MESKQKAKLTTDQERTNLYSQIFQQDLEASKKQFIERMGREPTFEELLSELRAYTHFFYQPCVAFLMILFAFAEL